MTRTLDKLDTINDSLNDIKTAIIGKGQTPSGNITTYATAIDNIVQSSPVIDSLSITPTTSAQTITAPSGTDGYSPVNVAAVTASIDNNIVASNIVSGVSILGVNGSATVLNGDTLSVTPSTSAQTLTPTSPKNGFTQVSVSAVTSNIDANITAENIKKDVTILGVTGSLESGGGSDEPKMIANYVLKSSNGTNYTIEALTKNGNFLNPKSTQTTSSTPALDTAYMADTTVREVNLSALITTQKTYSFYRTFFQCTNLESVDFSSLTDMSPQQRTFDSTFRFCSSLQNINFPSLTTSSGAYDFDMLFGDSGLVTIKFPKLSTVTGERSFNNIFYNCKSLKDIYFNSFNTTSFGSRTDQMMGMFNTDTGSLSGGVTVHFPNNLQSIISSLSGYPTFGGTSGYVTLAFDLPATS